MNKGRKLWNVMKNGGLFLIIAVITLRIFFFNDNFKETVEIISKVNLIYIAIGILFMFIVVLCEGINIKRSLNLCKEEFTLKESMKCSLTGMFFSSITPSASGGQPMQLYFMHKRGKKISSGTLTLLICLASYQFVAVLAATLSIVFERNIFYMFLGKYSILFFIGMTLNTVLLVFIIMAIFSNKIIFNTVSLVTYIIKRFNMELSIKFNDKALIEIKKYKSSAEYLKGNRKFIINTVLISFIQIMAFHSIPFWAYKALGLPGIGIFDFIFIQAALYITGAALPFPGAMGIGECGFLVFFQCKFAKNMINSAMLISRGISFYMMLLISGAVVLTSHFNRNSSNKPIASGNVILKNNEQM